MHISANDKVPNAFVLSPRVGWLVGFGYLFSLERSHESPVKDMTRPAERILVCPLDQPSVCLSIPLSIRILTNILKSSGNGFCSLQFANH